jgi:endogenous inhibitor of DNA gyrase (YacG/DUF329 family)
MKLKLGIGLGAIVLLVIAFAYMQPLAVLLSPLVGLLIFLLLGVGWGIRTIRPHWWRTGGRTGTPGVKPVVVLILAMFVAVAHPWRLVGGIQPGGFGTWWHWPALIGALIVLCLFLWWRRFYVAWGYSYATHGVRKRPRNYGNSGGGGIDDPFKDGIKPGLPPGVSVGVRPGIYSGVPGDWLDRDSGRPEMARTQDAIVETWHDFEDHSREWILTVDHTRERVVKCPKCDPVIEKILDLQYRGLGTSENIRKIIYRDCCPEGGTFAMMWDQACRERLGYEKGPSGEGSFAHIVKARKDANLPAQWRRDHGWEVLDEDDELERCEALASMPGRAYDTLMQIQDPHIRERQIVATVAAFRSSGNTWAPSIVSAPDDDDGSTIVECAECGRSFRKDPNRPRQRFCSGACRTRNARKRS